MRIEQLRSFVGVYEAGSFTAAAQRLYTKQPVVSKHVLQLESELGCALFTRTKRNVTPTREGDLFYEKAAAALILIDQGISEVKLLNEQAKDRLVVGYERYYLDSVTTTWIQDFERDRSGQATITICEFPRQHIIGGLLNGDVDCAFLGATSEDLIPSYLEKVLISEMGENIVVGRGHRLAQRESVGFDDIVDEEFVYGRSEPTTTLSIVMRDFEDAGRNMRIRSTEFESSALRIIELGQGLVDLPDESPEIGGRTVAIPYVSRYRIFYYLVWNPSNKSELLRSLVDVTRRRASGQ